jgi:hypothetical protein
MDDIRDDDAQERLWPDLKMIESVKFNPGIWNYKCDVTNHATTNLIDLAIPLSANFDNEKQPLVYTVIISPFDAGTTFSFFLINECAVSVATIAPESAGCGFASLEPLKKVTGVPRCLGFRHYLLIRTFFGRISNREPNEIESIQRISVEISRTAGRLVQNSLVGNLGESAYFV